jgi:quercetin dioxygenase-like cupin family protein
LQNKPGHRAGLFFVAPPIGLAGTAKAWQHDLPWANWRSAMTGTAKPTVFIDNDRVVVTEWRFAPDANTGWHRHGHDYVVVPLMDGKVKLLTKDGESFAEMKKGVPYFRGEGVEHDVINANDGEYAFIEIELK